MDSKSIAESEEASKGDAEKLGAQIHPIESPSLDSKGDSKPSLENYLSEASLLKDQLISSHKIDDLPQNEEGGASGSRAEKLPDSVAETDLAEGGTSDLSSVKENLGKASQKKDPSSGDYKFPHVPNIPPIEFPPREPKARPLIDHAAGSPSDTDDKASSGPLPCSRHHSSSPFPNLLPPSELLCEKCSRTMLTYLSTLRSVMDNIMLDIVVKSIDNSSSQCPECLKEELQKAEPEIDQEVLQQIFQKPPSEGGAPSDKKSPLPENSARSSKKAPPFKGGHSHHKHATSHPFKDRRQESKSPSGPRHRDMPDERAHSEYRPHSRMPERTGPFSSIHGDQTTPGHHGKEGHSKIKVGDDNSTKDNAESRHVESERRFPTQTRGHEDLHMIEKDSRPKGEEAMHNMGGGHGTLSHQDATSVQDSPNKDVPISESSPFIKGNEGKPSAQEDSRTTTEETRKFDTRQEESQPPEKLTPTRRISWSAPPQKKSSERRISWSGTPRNPQKEAFVTVVSTNAQALGALVLGHSLRLVGVSRPLFALMVEDISPHLSHLLSTVWDDVMSAESLGSSEAKRVALLGDLELGATFEKLHVWRLEGRFDKCVFLEPDTLVVQKCEELFDREELSAVPDIGWPDCFHPGVFVCRPSRQTFLGLVELAASQGSYDGGEQHVLNMYFRNWRMDIYKKLPFIYNLMASVAYTYTPAFKRFGSDVKIVNFMGNYKPWNVAVHRETGLLSPSANIHPSYVHFVRYWLEIFLKRVLPLLPRECQEYAAQQKYVTAKDALREIDVSLDQDGGQTLPTALSIRLRVPRIVAVPPTSPSSTMSPRSRQHAKSPQLASPQSPSHPRQPGTEAKPTSEAPPAERGTKADAETPSSSPAADKGDVKVGPETSAEKKSADKPAEKDEAEDKIDDPYRSMQAWEQGRMDYLGQDRSENILKRLDFLIHDTSGK